MSFLKKSLPLLAIVLVIAAVFMFMAGNSPSETEAVNSENVRIIEHPMGTTQITGTPVRIVTLFQGATDVAVALDVIPVGVVESWVEKPMYDYLKETLANAKIVGMESQPNLEEIAKLKPDLIVGSKLRNEKVYAQLSAIAPTITLESVFSFKDTIAMIGKALNRQEQAAQLLLSWQNRVADFHKKIKAKLGDAWPIEVSVLNFRGDHARIYVSGYAADILAELGFIKPQSQVEAAASGSVVLSLTTKESIPAMNASTLFIFNEDKQEVQKTYEDWSQHPLWKNLDGVKNNRVYKVNLVDWNMGGGYITANNMLDQIYDHFELKK